MRALSMTFILAAAVLAGCVEDSGDGDGPDAGSEACPLTLPDGTPHDCEGTGFDDVDLGPFTKRSVTEGWICSGYDARSGRDLRLYSHVDGRFEAAWDWTHAFDGKDLPDGGIVVGEVSRFHEDGHWGTRFPIDMGDPTGSVLLPDMPESGSTVLVRAIHFSIAYTDGDEPEPILDAELIVDEHNDAEGWYAWAVPSPNGTVYIDMMEPQGTEYGRHTGLKDFAVAEVDGREVTSDPWGAGVVFSDQPATRPRTNCET